MMALQLYTIREHLKTPDGVEKSFKRVKEIGYDTVQFGNTGFLEAGRLRELLDEVGLSVYGSSIRLHEGFMAEINEFIELQKKLGIKDVCLGMPPENRTSREGYDSFIAQANEISQIFAANGIRSFYHNHNFEFAKFDGTLGMDLLINGLNSENFDIEIDTYWVQAGGADPAQWIRKVAGRIQSVHFKDMQIDVDRKQLFAEVGEGNMNWSEIIKACREAGVTIYCVEQDTCRGDSLESVEISYINMKAMGI